MKRFVQAAILSVSVIFAAPCHAERLPLWEVGAGMAALDVPDYRGSDVRKTWLLPVPYVVYRGKFLKADRNGLRAALFESSRLQVNLSVNGSVPVSSKDNRLRSGMADLRPTVEFGPTADFQLWNSADRRMQLEFGAPLRAAITIESSPKPIGWLFAPHLDLGITDPAGFSGWKFGARVGPIFNSRRYNRYFYSVQPAEATAGRPAYTASGGYAGTQWTTTLSRRFHRYWVGAFLRYDNLAGAAFRDSPLVRRRGTVSAGLAVAWIFSASSMLVDSAEEP